MYRIAYAKCMMQWFADAYVEDVCICSGNAHEEGDEIRYGSERLVHWWYLIYH
jgi:hypothetical protein